MRAEAAPPGNLGDGEIGLLREPLMRFERRATPIGHEIFARLAARFGEAVGIGERQQRADGRGSPLPERCCPSPSLPPCAACPRPASTGRAGSARPGRPDPTASPPRPRSTRTAASIGRFARLPALAGLQHHARESRRQGRSRRRRPVIRDAPLAIERAELLQQRRRLLQGGRRRRIEEGERCSDR